MLNCSNFSSGNYKLSATRANAFLTASSEYIFSNVKQTIRNFGEKPFINGTETGLLVFTKKPLRTSADFIRSITEMSDHFGGIIKI